MSNWYDVMVLVSHGDTDKIPIIDEWVKQNSGTYRYNEKYYKFKKMDYFHNAYYAYINYFDLEGFIEFLKTLDWEYAYRTQVFVMDETGMDRYELINIE